MTEALRVLKPGGRLVIIDIEHSDEYRRALATLGAQQIEVTNAGLDGGLRGDGNAGVNGKQIKRIGRKNGSPGPF